MYICILNAYKIKKNVGSPKKILNTNILYEDILVTLFSNIFLS